jgi:hypothetical protein|tara:strand:- start:284 stop:1852 length:1569 start_codon:yes stop_codon:yes gene_type:complete
MANFNVDGNGNLWIGTNVSNTFSTAQGQSDTKFYVTNAGAIHAESGDIGGIVVDEDGVESSNFDAATNTGWRLDNSAGIAQYFDIDIQLSSAASDTPSTGSTTLDIGSAQLFENNDDLFINTSGTTNFVNIRDRLKLTSTSSSGSNMQLMFDGVSQNDAMGFRHVVNGAINSGDADLIWTNQSGASDYNNIAYVTTTDDYFHLGSDAPGIKTDYTGSPTFYFDGPGSPGSDSATFNMAIRPYAIKDKDGQVGSSGQVLSSTGSRIDWIDLPSSGGSHSDSDHTSFVNHVDTSSGGGGGTDALTISGTGIRLNFGTTSTRVAVGNHDHDSDYITGISTSGSGPFISSASGSTITRTSSGANTGSIYPASSYSGPFGGQYYGSDLGTSSKRYANLYVGNVTEYSDENSKNTIEDAVLGLDFINELRPVSYKYNETNDYTGTDEDGAPTGSKAGVRKHYGFIAQEVKQVLDDMSVSDEDFAGHVADYGAGESLRYREIFITAIKAIQELSTQISDLTARIEVLEG